MTRHFPWPTVDGFDFQVASITIDGSDESEAIDRQHHVIGLRDRGNDWSRCVLAVECPFPEGPIPAQADASLVLTNSPGRVWTSAPLVRTNATFVGDLTVDREELLGRATLGIFLAAEIDGVAHRVVGESRTWTLDIDESDRTFSTGRAPIEIIWKKFSDAESPAFLRPSAREPYHLHFGATEPVLFLNEDLTEFHQLLMWDTAQTWKRDLRDAMSSGISGKVISALTWVAFDSLIADEDSGEIDGPNDQVLVGTLEAVAEHMEGTGSAEELKEQVVGARATGEGMDGIAERVAAAVESLTDQGSLATRFGKRALE